MCRAGSVGKGRQGGRVVWVVRWRVDIDRERAVAREGGWLVGWVVGARRTLGTGAGRVAEAATEERRRMESVERRKSAASSNPASTPRAGAAASSAFLRVCESA